jgi:hypothetical protein
MAEQDDVGSRGEYLFAARIMSFCGRDLPCFRPRFLGEKARTLDFLVELVRRGDGGPFFFAQVKTTRKGYTKKDRRLRVETSGAEVRRACSVPAPTYLIGFDEWGEAGYIFPILDGMVDAISSIPTTHPLDDANLRRLYDEVEQFWSSRDMRMRTSVFSCEGGGT